MKRIFLCDWFFIEVNVFGNYGLDFVLANVLLAGWLAACCCCFCFLLPFPFTFFEFISFHLISCQIDRDHQDHTAFGIEIDQNLRFQNGSKHSRENQPKNSWTTLFTWRSELTLFTNPLLITSPHYKSWKPGWFRPENWQFFVTCLGRFREFFVLQTMIPFPFHFTSHRIHGMGLVYGIWVYKIVINGIEYAVPFSNGRKCIGKWG